MYRSAEVMEELRARPEAHRDSRVEVVKVKMRTRNRKVKVPLEERSDQNKNEMNPLPPKVFAETSVTPLQPDFTPDCANKSQDQFDFEADFNGNLQKETGGISPLRNHSSLKARDSVVLEMQKMTSSTSNLSHVKPTNIPVERFPQEENFIDIAVAEVVTPSKLYVNMGKYVRNSLHWLHIILNSFVL